MSDWQRHGYGTVTPHLIVDGAADLVEFLEATFDGEILSRHDHPDGTLLHAEVCIGDSLVVVAEALDEDPMYAALYVYVEDCDDAFAAALEAGASIVTEPGLDRKSGERVAVVTDPTGNVWRIATKLGDPELVVADEEPPDWPEETDS